MEKHIFTLPSEVEATLSKHAPLLNHQIEGIHFLLTHNRALLADEAGLGKTRTVLEAAKHRVGRRNLLVLCPTSVVEHWKAQAKLWGFPEHKITVLGWEYRFLHAVDQLKKQRWGVIVADEGHYLKNWKAQRTKCFKALIEKRDSCIWILTGTPVVKGAMDLHPLLSFLQPGVWGKFGQFCEDYCEKRINRWVPGGYEYYGVKAAKALSIKVKKIMLRRYKKDVLHDLPDKLISRVPLQLGGSFDIFNSQGVLEKVLANVEHAGSLVMADEVMESLQELGAQKVQHVIDFIDATLGTHPLILFAHHRIVLFDLAEKLREKGRKVEVIIGGMSKEQKWTYIQKFQRGEIEVLVCGILVAGIGIDLNRASHCVFAEFPWTQAAIDQAADRLHRIGQKNCVNVYYCYARGTFEDSMLRAIESRRYVTKEIVGYDRQAG